MKQRHLNADYLEQNMNDPRQKNSKIFQRPTTSSSVALKGRWLEDSAVSSLHNLGEAQMVEPFPLSLECLRGPQPDAFPGHSYSQMAFPKPRGNSNSNSNNSKQQQQQQEEEQEQEIEKQEGKKQNFTLSLFRRKRGGPQIFRMRKRPTVLLFQAPSSSFFWLFLFSDILSSLLFPDSSHHYFSICPHCQKFDF